ncbi:hypothetical protein R3P38DRAFT_3238347 [Favolaschia claudopus]|uniref:Uncharacterized protein n=1 Tax=Favolaschia claudopus TaxID=2862362 RepID=A0AAV9ZAL5_9AGAR
MYFGDSPNPQTTLSFDPDHHPPLVPTMHSFDPSIPFEGFDTAFQQLSPSTTEPDPFPDALCPTLFDRQSPSLVAPATPAVDSPGPSALVTVFSASTNPKPTTRTRRAATPASTPPPHTPEITDVEPPEFEILIHVIVEEKKVAGKKARGKQPKSAPAKFGPVTANVGFSFYQLTAKLAAALETDPVYLIKSTFEPANSMFIPIRDANGMRSLIKHLLSPPKGASANFIIPQMSAPVPKTGCAKRPLTNVAQSWSGAGAGTSAQAVLALDDSKTLTKGQLLYLCFYSHPYQVPFDVGLEDEMDKIAEAYPPGRCAQHPDISCFHYRQNNLHWELDRNKKIAWAAKKGTANLLKPPLGSNFFTAQSALKTRGSLPTTPRLPATPSTSVSVNMATPTPALP